MADCHCDIKKAVTDIARAKRLSARARAQAKARIAAHTTKAGKVVIPAAKKQSAKPCPCMTEPKK